MKKTSSVSWIKYDIHWDRLAKSSCKMCHGRGFEGFEVLTEEQERIEKEKDENWTPALMLCECCAKQWLKMTDEERMKYATLKENAQEMQDKAVKMVEKIVKEEAEKSGIELSK